MNAVDSRKIEASLESGQLSASDLAVLRRFNMTDKQIAAKLGGV